MVQSPLFRWKYILLFYLEIKVPESGGREEKHRIHVAWSPVCSFHSQWWFGPPCHLLVLILCVFWSPQSTQTSTGTFWSTSCFLLLTSVMEMLISFSSRTWHLPTLPKVPKAGSMTMCYDWPANSPDLNLIENLDERHQTQQCRWPEAHRESRWETPDPIMQMTWSPSRI